MGHYSLQISSKSEMVMREPFSGSGDLTRNDPKSCHKCYNLVPVVADSENGPRSLMHIQVAYA